MSMTICRRSHETGRRNPCPLSAPVRPARQEAACRGGPVGRLCQRCRDFTDEQEYLTFLRQVVARRNEAHGIVRIEPTNPSNAGIVQQRQSIAATPHPPAPFAEAVLADCRRSARTRGGQDVGYSPVLSVLWGTVSP
jgi:hypothetical protein